MGLEENLLLEEEEEGHEEQLLRCKTAYDAEGAGPSAIFEYGWVLCRSNDEKNVREGIKLLKALSYEVKKTRGHSLLAIAQATSSLASSASVTIVSS